MSIYVLEQGSESTEQLIARYEYDGSLRPTLIARPSVNPEGEHITKITYNDDQLPIALTEKGFTPNSQDDGFSTLERTTKLGYTNGNLTTIDGPREDVQDLIQLSYDPQNRLQSLTQANGQTLKVLAYDVNGHPTQIQKGTQSPLSIEYASNNNQIKTIKQRSKSIDYAYDPEGRLTQITTSSTDGSSETIKMAYDEAGRLDTLNDDKGQQIQQLHDSESRPTQTKLMGSSGNVLTTISYLYDAQGRLDKTNSQNLDGDSETDYQYDDKGQLTQVEKNGQAVNLSYNNLGQLLGLTQPGEVVTQFSYDNKGQSTALTDARDNKTQTIKDDFGRTVQHISPDTGTNSYAYDKTGNRIKRTDPEGTITTYQWDKANKLTKKENKDGVTTYQYDNQTGKLASTTNPNTTESFKYNSEGQLTNHTREIDGHSFTTEYEYNDQDRLKYKTLPDGQKLRYHYYTQSDNKPNQIGKLRAITRETWIGMKQENIISEIDNDKTDNQTSFVSHNGLRTEYTFREDRQLQNIEIAEALKLKYSYDQNGNITGIDENGMVQSFLYDQGRLTFADTLTGQYWYTYDALGNRTQKVHATKEGNILNDNYQYPEKAEGNQLTALSIDNLYELADQSKQYTYNKNGSPINTDEFSYEYNSDQRPVKVYKTRDGNQQLIAEYSYNSFGERVKKKVYSKNNETKTTYFFYDLQILAGKANAQGDVTTEYLYLNRKPVAKLEKNTTYAIHSDHRNAPRMMTNGNKQTVWQASYFPFGEISIKKQTVALQLRLPGQYEDKETGTYYNYFRDYDPKTGRYITSDPLSTQAGLNTYAYVKNDPLNRVDPLGLNDELVHYYMTYFLAVVAGVPKNTAITIAQATQYIDDNPLTTSVIFNHYLGVIPRTSPRAMRLYHFVLDHNDPNKHHGDNTNNPLTRFINPDSSQLRNLRTAAMTYNIDACILSTGRSARDTKAQLYGEYLHAFEDSFAHRDRNNISYETWSGMHNDPGGLYGHTTAGHTPDHTYNNTSIGHDQLTGQYTHRAYYTQWAYNEARTLEAEKEVFERFQQDFSTEISRNPPARSFSWQDLAGDGTARLGTQNYGSMDSAWVNNRAPIWQDGNVTDVLQRFNHERDKEAKIEILNTWLTSHGFTKITDYVLSDAQDARNNNLQGLQPMDGVLLPE